MVQGNSQSGCLYTELWITFIKPHILHRNTTPILCQIRQVFGCNSVRTMFELCYYRWEYNASTISPEKLEFRNLCRNCLVQQGVFGMAESEQQHITVSFLQRHHNVVDCTGEKARSLSRGQKTKVTARKFPVLLSFIALL